MRLTDGDTFYWFLVAIGLAGIAVIMFAVRGC